MFMYENVSQHDRLTHDPELPKRMVLWMPSTEMTCKLEDGTGLHMPRCQENLLMIHPFWFIAVGHC